MKNHGITVHEFLGKPKEDIVVCTGKNRRVALREISGELDFEKRTARLSITSLQKKSDEEAHFAFALSKSTFKGDIKLLLVNMSHETLEDLMNTIQAYLGRKEGETYYFPDNPESD